MRRPLLPLALGLLAGLAPTVARADSGAQVWGAAVLQANLSKAIPRLHLWTDLHTRYGSTGAVTIVRPALGLELTSGLLLHAGYGWIARWPEGGDALHEHRVWEQLQYARPASETLDLLLRLRFEQRIPDGGGDVALRLRGMARLLAWFAKDAPVGVVIQDEVFFGLAETDWAVGGFDQNRAFVGFAVRGVARTRFELGYLNLFFLRRGGEGRLDHVASFNLFVSL